MSSVWYGQGVPDDAELRLCGDMTGKRTIELGVTPVPATQQANAVVLAAAGAKSIVVDPSAERITGLRSQADEAEVRVECHVGELADLGFATSASVDLVIATHTIDDIDDLPRTLRQVHRILKPEAAFVVAMTHPVARMFDTANGAAQRPYGHGARPFAELYMAFVRTNFHLDVIHELFPRGENALAPSVLVMRARKQGV